jgi:hypothetical protein
MKTGIIGILIMVVLIVGEVKCIIKAFQCNWEPIGKAEAVYTVAIITGVGSIVGYLDVEDK